MKDFVDRNLAGGRFTGFEPRWNNKSAQICTSPWRSYITVGGALTSRKMLHNGYEMHLWVYSLLLDVEIACHNG
jgi:hypothetical protein